MLRKSVEITKSNKKDKVANITSNFETLKNTPTTRTVKLIYTSCCGCGCSDITISREVSFDSTLRDGDRVEKLERTDKQID